jgi:hypothetical protein
MDNETIFFCIVRKKHEIARGKIALSFIQFISVLSPLNFMNRKESIFYEKKVIYFAGYYIVMFINPNDGHIKY